eukprot:9093659-Pyramimonas_sp.AAC.2
MQIGESSGICENSELRNPETERDALALRRLRVAERKDQVSDSIRELLGQHGGSVPESRLLLYSYHRLFERLVDDRTTARPQRGVLGRVTTH